MIYTYEQSSTGFFLIYKSRFCCGEEIRTIVAQFDYEKDAKEYCRFKNMIGQSSYLINSQYELMEYEVNRTKEDPDFLECIKGMLFHNIADLMHSKYGKDVNINKRIDNYDEWGCNKEYMMMGFFIIPEKDLYE